MEHIENLEKELSNKNEVIDILRKEKQIKAEETVKAQTVNIVLLKFLGIHIQQNIEQAILCFIDRKYNYRNLHPYQKSQRSSLRAMKLKSRTSKVLWKNESTP